MELDRVKVFTNGLRQAGLRVTLPRLAICRMLAQSAEHPTAVQLYEQLRPDFPSLSLATVYNTLNTLLALGLVGEIGDAADGQRHYDPNTTLHANLICTRCHQIRDLEDDALESVSRRIASRSGYHLQGARVVFYGECPTCAKRRKP